MRSTKFWLIYLLFCKYSVKLKLYWESLSKFPNVTDIVFWTGNNMTPIVVNIAGKYFFRMTFKKINVSTWLCIPYSCNSIHSCCDYFVSLRIEHDPCNLTLMALQTMQQCRGVCAVHVGSTISRASRKHIPSFIKIKIIDFPSMIINRLYHFASSNIPHNGLHITTARSTYYARILKLATVIFGRMPNKIPYTFHSFNIPNFTSVIERTWQY